MSKVKKYIITLSKRKIIVKRNSMKTQLLVDPVACHVLPKKFPFHI